MPYGVLKVDTITFTDGGVDKSISISGLVQNPTVSGNITSTGTISGDVIRGGSTVSGGTVTGTAGQFGTLTGTTANLATVSGTTATFVTVSGTTVTGGSAQFISVTGNTAGFTTVTGATVTGTTANFISGVFTTQLSGATITGNVGQYTTITGGTAGFTTVTGTTVTGSTANFVSGVFTSQISGATITGNVGQFTTFTGGIATITSGVFASGTTTNPSISVGSASNGFWSPGNNQLAVSTDGIENLRFGTTEVVVNEGGADIDFRIEGDTNPDLFRIDAGTDEVRVANLNGGQLAGTRNKVINGEMLIAQRGTSFAAIANGTYSLDRWLWGQAGAMACTVTQSTDVPNDTFQNSYKVDVTTADTSIAAGDVASVQQRIEGYNVRDLIGRTFTLSFWVKSPKTGTHCVSLGNTGTDRSYVAEYTVASANTWEYKTVTVIGGLITAGTWDWTNGFGVRVIFALACGTTFQTTAGSWQTGNFIATANQVNVMDNTANDFYITGVQLEVGTVATPFERRSYGQELALCQRYARWQPLILSAYATAGITVTNLVVHPVPMRAAPTAGANVQDPEYPTAGTTNVTVAGVGNTSSIGCTPFMTVTVTGGASVAYFRSFLSAEL